MPAKSPMNPTTSDAKIRVVFKGLIITEIREGATKKAKIGALANSHCHQPKIQVYKITRTKTKTKRKAQGDATVELVKLEFNLSKELSLEVTKPPKPGIQVHQKDYDEFERLNEIDNDRKDFRWFVDLNELHKDKKGNPVPVKIQWEKLRPVFTLNNGLFHTSGRSDRDAKIKRFEKIKRFGRFGLEITARIDFKSDTTAVFKNDGKVLYSFEAADNVRYYIIYDCSCYVDESESDFMLIYQAVEVDKEYKIDLLSDDSTAGSRKNPEVYCTGGNGG